MAKKKRQSEATIAYETLQANRVALEMMTHTAAELYHKALYDRELGAQARRWFGKRKITDATWCEWGLGAAPAERGWLLSQLSKVFTSVALRHSGLLIFDADSGDTYDRFRRRVVLPVRDAWGSVLSLTGRALDEETYPKYAGTPNTIIFNKQSALFGLDHAFVSIVETGKALVVEGQLDALMLHQHGITNSVALMGTTLAAEHIHQLSRWCGRIVFLADADEGGLKALQRADDLRRGRELGVELKLVRIPAEEGDPDSYIRKHGADEFRKSLERWEAIS